MTSRAYGARSSRSHYDVILIVTSFATELATPTFTEVRTYGRRDTLQRLIYKDKWQLFSFQTRTSTTQVEGKAKRQNKYRVKIVGVTGVAGLLGCAARRRPCCHVIVSSYMISQASPIASVLFIMVALCNTADHYILASRFLSSFQCNSS